MLHPVWCGHRQGMPIPRTHPRSPSPRSQVARRPRDAEIAAGREHAAKATPPQPVKPRRTGDRSRKRRVAVDRRAFAQSLNLVISSAGWQVPPCSAWSGHSTWRPYDISMHRKAYARVCAGKRTMPRRMPVLCQECMIEQTQQTVDRRHHSVPVRHRQLPARHVGCTSTSPRISVARVDPPRPHSARATIAACIIQPTRHGRACPPPVAPPTVDPPPSPPARTPPSSRRFHLLAISLQRIRRAPDHLRTPPHALLRSVQLRDNPRQPAEPMHNHRHHFASRRPPAPSEPHRHLTVPINEPRPGAPPNARKRQTTSTAARPLTSQAQARTYRGPAPSP